MTVRKTNNVRTQLGHFHAVIGQVPQTGSPMPVFEVQTNDY